MQNFRCTSFDFDSFIVNQFRKRGIWSPSAIICHFRVTLYTDNSGTPFDDMIANCVWQFYKELQARTLTSVRVGNIRPAKWRGMKVQHDRKQYRMVTIAVVILGALLTIGPFGTTSNAASKSRRSSPWLAELPSIKQLMAQAVQTQRISERLKRGELSIANAIKLIETNVIQLYAEREAAVRQRYKHIPQASLEGSLRQARVSRMGKLIELILEWLLVQLEIPADKQVSYPEAGMERLDIVVPGAAQLKQHPESCVVISVKRAVRERWREVVGEAYILRQLHGYRGKICMVAISTDISDYAVKCLTKLNIGVYLPDSLFRPDARPHLRNLGAQPVSILFRELRERFSKRVRDGAGNVDAR